MSFSSRAFVPRIPKVLVAILVGIITIVPMAIGLAAVTNVHAQAPKSNKQAQGQKISEGPLSCVFASVGYPEGTVIQQEGGPEQMCARVLNPSWNNIKEPPFSVQWIRTSNSIRERSKTIVHLSAIKEPEICIPKSSAQTYFCSCESGSNWGQNSEVESLKGRLRCDQGKWVSLPKVQAQLK